MTVGRRRELVIVVAVALLVSTAVFFLLLRPKSAEISAARAERQRAVDEAQTLRTEIKALEDVRANAAALRKRAEAARNLFPGGPDLPDLVDGVQKVADQSGVELVSLQPSPPAASTANPLLAEIGAVVVVRGGYFQIEDFLARLEGMVKSPDPGSGIPPRSVLLRSVNISTGGGAEGGGGTTPTPGSTGAGSDKLTANVGLVVFQSAKAPTTAGAGTGAASPAPGGTSPGTSPGSGTPGAGAAPGAAGAGPTYVAPGAIQRRSVR